MYRCIYLYQNTLTSSFFFSEEINSEIYDCLLKRSEFLSEDQRDPFFRDHLISAISDLVESKFESVDLKFLKKNNLNNLKIKTNLFTFFIILNENFFISKSFDFFI
jgi:hypothetical protein